jgi:hypothetical protein
MASYADMGHAMRRRTGAPSNHLEAAGKSMKRNNSTSDEAIANAGSSARVSMGATVVKPEVGKLMPKKNTQAADPTAGGKGPRRTPILNAGGERLGAAYVVKANYGQMIDPAAGATMANARIVPSVAGKSRPNFDNANNSSY